MSVVSNLLPCRNQHYIISFVDSCDLMIDMIADYENEMYAEYISEMRASMNRYYVDLQKYLLIFVPSNIMKMAF